MLNFDRLLPEQTIRLTQTWFDNAKNYRSKQESVWKENRKLHEMYIPDQTDESSSKYPFKSRMHTPAGFAAVQAKLAALMDAVMATGQLVTWVPEGGKADKVKADLVTRFNNWRIMQVMGFKSAFYSHAENMLIYGTAFFRLIWDAGRNCLKIDVPDIWDVYPDPYGRTIDECEYIIYRQTRSLSSVAKEFGNEIAGEVAKKEAWFDEKDWAEEVNSWLDYTSPPKDLSSRESPFSKKCEVLETWTDTHRWVVINGVLAVKPTAHKFTMHERPKKPWFKTCCYPTSNQFYGRGEYDITKYIIQEINDFFNLTSDNLMIANYPTFMVNRDADIDEDQLILTPGGHIEFTPTSDKHFPLQPVPSPSFDAGLIINRMQQLNQWMQDGTGVNELVSGEQGIHQTKTSSGIRMLLSQSFKRFGIQVFQCAMTVEGIARLTKSTDARLLPPESVFPYFDKGEWQYVDMDSETISGVPVDFRAVASPLLGLKGAWSQVVLNVMTMCNQYGIPFDNRAAAKDYAVLNDMPGVESYFPNTELVGQDPQQENMLMAEGKYVEVGPYDDDEAHVQVHQSMIIQADENEVPLPQHVIMLIGEHIRKHGERMTQSGGGMNVEQSPALNLEVQ